MATPGKRVIKAAVNWKQVTDKLTSQHATEVAALKGQYLGPADLPEYDFEALKKQMPTHKAVLESLQKQYEALKIPAGKIPDSYLKVEEKWAAVPPVEHSRRDYFVEYFPQQFYDLRYQERVPDPC